MIGVCKTEELLGPRELLNSLRMDFVSISAAIADSSNFFFRLSLVIDFLTVRFLMLLVFRIRDLMDNRTELRRIFLEVESVFRFPDFLAVEFFCKKKKIGVSGVLISNPAEGYQRKMFTGLKLMASNK